MLQISELLKLVLAPESNGAQGEVADGGGADRLIERTSLRFRNGLPPVVVWNVNHRCNMTCPHCYASAKLAPAFDGVTTAQALQIIDKLAAFGISILIFSGGEPLMREDLFELIGAAKGQGMSCHLSSNGTLITADAARRLKAAGISYAGVSIDGLQEFNDEYRGLEHGFELAWEGILNAKAAGISTGVRMTVTETNQEHLLPLLELVSEREVPRFYLSHLVYGGRGRAYARHDLEQQRARRLMTMVLDRAVELVEAERGPLVVTGGNDADGPFLYLYVKRRFGAQAADLVYRLLEARGGNSAGEKIINIDHKGQVHPDQFWQTSDCGNLLEQSLEEILSCDLISALRGRLERLTGRCGSCVYRPVCRGSHRERALASFGDVWAEDPSCYLSEAEILRMDYGEEHASTSAGSGTAADCTPELGGAASD